MAHTPKIVPSVKPPEPKSTFTLKCVLTPVLMAITRTILLEFVKYAPSAFFAQLVKLILAMSSAKHAMMDTIYKLTKPVQLDAISMTLKMNGIIVVIHAMPTVETVQVPMILLASTVETGHTFCKTQQEDIA